MEAMLTNGFGPVPHQAPHEALSSTPESRTARGATVFAALWLAIAVGSPLIVRYAPSADDHAMTALVKRMEQPRCASAPEFGYPCPGRTLIARDVDSAKAPDL